MNKRTARLIRELKRGCSYRRLAEIYYPKYHDGHGNQGFGDELCFKAFKVLFEMSHSKYKQLLSVEFVKENCSFYSRSCVNLWEQNGADLNNLYEYDISFWWE